MDEHEGVKVDILTVKVPEDLRQKFKVHLINSLAKLTLAWTEAEKAPGTNRRGYSLIFLNVTIELLPDDGDLAGIDHSEGLQDLLRALWPEGMARTGDSSSSWALLVVPEYPNSSLCTLDSTKDIINSTDAINIHVRHLDCNDINYTSKEDIQSVLNSSLMFISSSQAESSSVSISKLVNEMDARLEKLGNSLSALEPDRSESQGLSRRGEQWSKVEYLHGLENTFDQDHNPSGIVRLDVAENSFMHEDLAKFINENNHFSAHTCSYGEGYTGTTELRTAMAYHMNEYFHPVHDIDPEELTFTAGVTDLNEVCSMVFCDPGDYLLLAGLCYGTFNKDLCMRTGVKLVRANVGDTDQFSPACIAQYESALDAAEAAGQNIKALVICNPHNPLGQCYPPETLEGLLKLCAVRKIQLISDEIYALSTYSRHERHSEKFTSILAVDYSSIIDPSQVHVLYGLSKDYGAAGMRLGCLVSRNKQLHKATRAICRFSSPSQFSMDLATKFLSDRPFVRHFLDQSHKRLLQSRLKAEDLLEQANISYHNKGNAGLFVWIDLASYLPVEETRGDAWAAEKLLSGRFKQAGLYLDSGTEYYASQPGGFRMVITVPEPVLQEGVRRMVNVLSQLRTVESTR